MFPRVIAILCTFFIFFPAQAKTLATISYSNAKGPVTINITLDEFLKTYRNVKQIAPNTPPAKKFFEEYLQYRIGLEHAYNDRTLVKNPSIRNMFSDPLLKEGFEDLLYKHLAEKKLKKKVAKINKQAKKLSKKIMLNFYKKYPEYDLHFILISIPGDSKPNQIKEAKARATKIYKEVRRSKKPFVDLVDIYSDDRIGGRLNIPRSRHTTYPSIYKQIKRMKKGQISAPIETPNGFYIVKLNRRIPFAQANQTQIKAAYFDQQRSKALSSYFNSLKSKYKVKKNTALLNNIR